MSTIEYFYSPHSAFAYLGAPRLMDICAGPGIRLFHKPFDFQPVVRAAGAPPPAERSAAYHAYFFGREIVRWAEWRGLPVIARRPTHHDNPLDLAGGLIIAAQEAGLEGHTVDALSFAILQAHWRDDADIADARVLGALLGSAGLDRALLDAARSEPVQAIFRANTEEAIARDVFGSPTYIVDGDPFFGQDRLDLVDRALTRPFAPNAWRPLPEA